MVKLRRCCEWIIQTKIEKKTATIRKEIIHNIQTSQKFLFRQRKTKIHIGYLLCPMRNSWQIQHVIFNFLSYCGCVSCYLCLHVTVCSCSFWSWIFWKRKLMWGYNELLGKYKGHEWTLKLFTITFFVLNKAWHNHN